MASEPEESRGNAGEAAASRGAVWRPKFRRVTGPLTFCSASVEGGVTGASGDGYQRQQRAGRDGMAETKKGISHPRSFETDLSPPIACRYLTEFGAGGVSFFLLLVGDNRKISRRSSHGWWRKAQRSVKRVVDVV